MTYATASDARRPSFVAGASNPDLAAPVCAPRPACCSSPMPG